MALKTCIEESNMTRIEAVQCPFFALLYQRTSQERRNGNPRTPNNLYSYRVYNPPLNHDSCFDVRSESSLMVIHTITITHVYSTMPYHSMLQHLKPLPCHPKWSCNHYMAFSHDLRTNQHHHSSGAPSPSRVRSE